MADSPMADSPMAENPDPQGHRARDVAATEPTDDVAIVPWLVVVVRAWTHEGRRIVRLTLSGSGRPPLVCYEPSSVAAGDRLVGWLDELPAPGLADRPARDVAGDGRETLRRRADGAALLTVSDGPQPQDEET